MKATLLGLVLAVQSLGKTITDAVCQSACGLVASADDCKRCVTQGNICLYLQRNQTGSLVFEDGSISGYQAVSIGEAKALVLAEDNNCFAMFEKNNWLSSASYCAENNVCPNLYWDKTYPIGNFSYFNSNEAASNRDINIASPVMCDYESAEKPHTTEHHPNEVDPCKALCNLSHSEDHCKLVKREDNKCMRLFWTDASRTSTNFSVRAAVGTQVQVTVKEARDLLIPENETCDSLCKADANCKKSESHCSENRTCKDLFFLPGVPVRKEMKICYLSDCTHDLTPVFCGYTNPSETTNQPGNQIPANSPINAVATKDDSSSQMSAAGLVSVVLALVFTLI